MAWRSVLIGFAAVTAFAIGSWGQSAPPIRSSTPEVPRYAVMLPPSDENVTPPQTTPTPPAATSAAPPAAAPTTPVTVSQAPPVAVGPPSPPVRVPQQRYSAMDQPKRLESVTVTGLRPSADSTYQLGTGDRVRVTVFNEGDLSGEFTIDSQGYVRLPLIGQVGAAGLSTYDLENRIATAMTGGGYLLNPKISVEVTSYRPFYIIGEVAKPGEYPYVNAMSAPNAIALAGGYSDRAVESVIWVRHQGERKERRLPADESTRILPGDVVRVERSTYWSVMTLLAPLISPFATTAYLLK